MPVPPLHLLTTDPDKRQRYTVDPLLREGWATLVGVLGAVAALRFASGAAIAWLRPDVAAAGAIGEVADRIDAAGFVAIGAVVVRLGRADVRALWWWQLQRATAERLLLLDAVAGLGPSLVALYRHPDGDPAQRLTRLKGGNDPGGRAPDSLRSVAGSPNRLLTMVHTSDDPADVVRELAVFLPWRERAALVASAWACGSPTSSSAVLDGPLGAVRAAYAGRAGGGVQVPAPQRRGEAFAALLGDIAVPDMTWRWPAVAQWSRQVPLLAGGQSR
ncbi:MAG TPA: nucleoside-diphosphate kinase [Trebonia sp.]